MEREREACEGVKGEGWSFRGFGRCPLVLGEEGG